MPLGEISHSSPRPLLRIPAPPPQSHHPPWSRPCAIVAGACSTRRWPVTSRGLPPRTGTKNANGISHSPVHCRRSVLTRRTDEAAAPVTARPRIRIVDRDRATAAELEPAPVPRAARILAKLVAHIPTRLNQVAAGAGQPPRARRPWKRGTLAIVAVTATSGKRGRQSRATHDASAEQSATYRSLWSPHHLASGDIPDRRLSRASSCLLEEARLLPTDERQHTPGEGVVLDHLPHTRNNLVELEQRRRRGCDLIESVRLERAAHRLRRHCVRRHAVDANPVDRSERGRQADYSGFPHRVFDTPVWIRPVPCGRSRC